MINKIDLHSEICDALNAMYEQKNHDYGDSFAQNFAEFGMVDGVMHMQEKLDRIKSLSTKDAMVDGESINDSLLDLANYAILTLIERGYEPVTAKERSAIEVECDACWHEEDCMRENPKCQCLKCANDTFGCCEKHNRIATDCTIKNCRDFEPESKVKNHED